MDGASQNKNENSCLLNLSGLWSVKLRLPSRIVLLLTRLYYKRLVRNLRLCIYRGYRSDLEIFAASEGDLAEPLKTARRFEDQVSGSACCGASSGGNAEQRLLEILSALSTIEENGSSQMQMRPMLYFHRLMVSDCSCMSGDRSYYRLF
jgi:hypothetical protein